MNETLAIWILTLATQMADGTVSVGAMAKENRRVCRQDLGEVAARADEAKAKGTIRSYAIECNVIELEIKGKYQ